MIAWNNYDRLTSMGVKIYEYTPGFIHAKTCVADGLSAVVGTINFDYRSFYLHFECGSVLYNVSVIKDIVFNLMKEDKYYFNLSLIKILIKLLDKVENPETIRSVCKKIAGAILNIFAPLL